MPEGEFYSMPAMIRFNCIFLGYVPIRKTEAPVVEIVKNSKGEVLVRLKNPTKVSILVCTFIDLINYEKILTKKDKLVNRYSSRFLGDNRTHLNIVINAYWKARISFS